MTQPILLPLSSLLGGQPQEAPVRPHPDAQAEELKALYARYAAPCPFVCGDLVTPRKNSGIKGHGEPHVVVEVIDGGLPSRWTNDRVHGFRLDIRLAFLVTDGEHYGLGWFESWAFEPYTGPVLTPVAAAPEAAPAGEPTP